ncbi:MAG: MiaB/RimO family radical SAM methylthiotransferase [Methanoregulaceae archaeon]|nr:MiaB/RimO family radical SAM methylthiotransferase [Methanoregulaceae archaeon]HRX33344.1 MiaB/RimO family radical SAM methylthiotransferase [Methanoregulaceae archaeon]
MAGIIRIYHPIACEKMHPEDDGTHRMRPTASSLDGLLNRTVHVMTFGCTYNSGDSRKLKEILKAQGCRLVDTPGEAEAVVVNTCTVVGYTERRMLRVLSSLREKELYVTGCMPIVQQDEISRVCSPRIIRPEEIRDHYGRVGTVEPCGVGILQVASGCLGSCTYCITRKARGRLKSVSVPDILAEAETMVDAGAKELQLTGQDVSAWGYDIGMNLSDLLLALGQIPGRFCIRTGMMNPSTLLPIRKPVIRAFASPEVFRFIHIPIQSGSDEILNAMGRKYTVGDAVRIVDSFRAKYPEIFFATDIIVGFPGETDSQFEESVDLVTRLKPNKVNITRYSRRPHTRMAGIRDTLDAIKKDRSRALLRHAEEIYRGINARFIGEKVRILVTEKVKDGSVISRTPAYHNVVIQKDLPIGYEGHAVILEDRMYYLLGSLC